MKKRKISIPVVALATSLVLGGAIGASLTSCNEQNVAKYKVNAPAASADYSVSGLSAEYAEGETVTFTVTVNNTAKEIDNVKANSSVINGNNGTYSFKMPATVVNIVVTLRDKEEPPTPVTHTIEATINGNATEGNTITLNVTYDGDPCTGYTLTDVSDSNDLITIDGKNIKLLKAGTAKVKVTYEGTEKVISITIEADTCQSLASIYKELGTELTKADYTIYSSKVYTTRAVIVAIGAASSKGYCDVIFSDGTTYGFYSCKSTYVPTVGKTYKISGKLVNYFGAFEFSSDSTNKIYVTATEDTERTITAPTDIVNWTDDDFDSYKEIAIANSSNLQEAQKETGVPIVHASITGTYTVSGSYKYLVSGTRKFSLNKTPESVLGTLVEGKKYKIETYVTGYNSGSSYDYLNGCGVKCEVVKVDATAITIDTPTSSNVDINETIKLTATVTPNDATGEVTWESSNTAIATVDSEGNVKGIAAGTAEITAKIDSLTSAPITITVNEHVAKCTVSKETTIANGALTLSNEGENIAPGEVTLTLTPNAGYEIESAYVYIDGVSEKTSIEATDGVYKYTTEDTHSYVFGATFKEIAVTKISEAKKLDDGEMVKIVGKVVATEGTSAYINDGTSGIYVYNWSKNTTVDTGLDSNGYLAKDSVVEIYGQVGTNAGAKQIVNYANKARVADSYVKTSTAEITTTSVSEITSKDGFSALTASDTGKVYKFKAKYVKGDTPSSTNAVSFTFNHDGQDVVLRTSKYDKKLSDLNVMLTTLDLKEGDLVEIEAVLTWYNGFQFAFLGDGSTKITKVDGETPTSLTLSASMNKVGVGQTIELSVEVAPWDATDKDVTYSFVEETTYATISGNVLTGVAAGTVKVVAKVGEVTSNEVEIEVTTDSVTEVVHNVAFNKTNNQSSVNSYSNSWENETDGVTYTIENMNNNSNGWNYVKCGHKKTTYVCSIATKASFGAAISKSSITIDSIKADYVNSIKLYVSSNSSYTDATTYDIEAKSGTIETTITTPTENCYYKYVFDLTAGDGNNNGFVQISGVTFTEAI